MVVPPPPSPSLTIATTPSGLVSSPAAPPVSHSTRSSHDSSPYPPPGPAAYGLAHSATKTFSCVTGDCGSSQIECSGGGANPPATLAEFTLNGAGNLDFYDVSLVDGYNVPQGGAKGVGNCTATGCAVDLNGVCPAYLKVEAAGVAVAYKSACEAFGTPEYCCSGAFGTPDTCKPSEYSGLFKKACPWAYSFAYDDGTSTFTCSAADYLITFCPPGYISN